MKNRLVGVAFSSVFGVGLGVVTSVVAKKIGLSDSMQNTAASIMGITGGLVVNDYFKKKEPVGQHTERLQEERQNQKSEQLRV